MLSTFTHTNMEMVTRDVLEEHLPHKKICISVPEIFTLSLKPHENISKLWCREVYRKNRAEKMRKIFPNRDTSTHYLAY